MTDKKIIPIHYKELVAVFEHDGFRVRRIKGDQNNSTACSGYPYQNQYDNCRHDEGTLFWNYWKIIEIYMERISIDLTPWRSCQLAWRLPYCCSPYDLRLTASDFSFRPSAFHFFYFMF